MKKVESLKQLLETIKDKELSSGKYCKDGKNCVIGHLLKIGGMTEQDLLEVDGPESEKNKYDNWYGIGSIINYINKEEIKDDLLDKTLSELGFNIRSEEDREILSRLQKVNDQEGKFVVNNHLKYIISKLSELESEEK